MKKIFVLFIIVSAYCFASTYMIIDAHGNTLNYNSSFNRVISLYPAHTEVIKELGGMESLVGISAERGVDTPEGIVEFNLGDSVEKFIALQPDLVLVRPMVEEKYKTLISMLRTRGIEVVSLHPKTSSELKDYWLSLGRLIGREDESEKYISEFETRLDNLRKRASQNQHRVFFEARHNRMIYTSAKDSIASYVLENAGVINVFGDKNNNNSTIVPVRHEELILKGNEIDIYIAQKGTMNNRTYEDINKSSGFNLIKAIREGRVLILDEKIVSRPTSSILDAIEQIIEYIEDEVV